LTTADGTPTDPAQFSQMVTTNLVGTFNVMSHGHPPGAICLPNRDQEQK
jgi:hypothetical protein